MSSKRQLLIAMKEATGEREFNSIIEDEFNGIKEYATRLLFLIVAVATLSRAGIKESTAREIFIGLFPSSDIKECLDTL